MLRTYARKVLVRVFAVVAVASAVTIAPWAAGAANASETFTYGQWSNAGAGKCLDAGGQASGDPVQQFVCNSTVNQQWRQVSTDSGYFVMVVASSGLCLQVPNSSQANDAVLNIADCNGAFNQQWTQAAAPVSGYLRLIARHSGKCIGIRFDDPADRAPAVQYDCDDGSFEFWKFRQFPDSYHTLQRDGQTLCLHAVSRPDPSSAVQSTCNSTVRQQWQMHATDSGYFTLTAAISGRCLQVPNSSQAENELLTIAGCTGAFNQQWTKVGVFGRIGVVTVVARHSGKCLSIAQDSPFDFTAAVQRTCNPLSLPSQNWQAF